MVCVCVLICDLICVFIVFSSIEASTESWTVFNALSVGIAGKSLLDPVPRIVGGALGLGPAQSTRPSHGGLA